MTDHISHSIWVAQITLEGKTIRIQCWAGKEGSIVLERDGEMGLNIIKSHCPESKFLKELESFCSS